MNKAKKFVGNMCFIISMILVMLFNGYYNLVIAAFLMGLAIGLVTWDTLEELSK